MALNNIQRRNANIVWTTLTPFIKNLSGNNPTQVNDFIAAMQQANALNARTLSMQSIEDVVRGLYNSEPQLFNASNMRYFLSKDSVSLAYTHHHSGYSQLYSAFNQAEEQINGSSPQQNRQNVQQNQNQAPTQTRPQSQAQVQPRPSYRAPRQPSSNSRKIPFLSQRQNDESVLGDLIPFIGQAEFKQLQNNNKLRYKKYKSSVVRRGIQVLQHLADTGAGFSIQDDPRKPGRINAVLDDSKNRIRLFTDKTQQVGAVLTNHGTIYMMPPEGSNVTPSPRPLIDFAVGNTPGHITQQQSGPFSLTFRDPVTNKPVHAHYSNQASRNKIVYSRHRKGRLKGHKIMVRGKDGHLHAKHHYRMRISKQSLHNIMARGNRDALLRRIHTFNNSNQNGSKGFLQLLIAHATQHYAEEVLGTDASGTDKALGDDQKNIIQPYMQKHGLTEDDKNKVHDVAQKLTNGNDFQFLNLDHRQQHLLSHVRHEAEQQEGVHVVDNEVTQDMINIVSGKTNSQQNQDLQNYMKQNHLNYNDAARVRSFVQNNASAGNFEINLNEAQLGLLYRAQAAAKDRVGTYEDGFDPNVIVNTERSFTRNVQNEIYLALNDAEYPASKLKTYTMKHPNGNADERAQQEADDPSLVSTKDHMLQFDPKNIAYTNSSANHPKVLDYISDRLKQLGITPPPSNSGTPARVPVQMDKHGIVHWWGFRTITQYHRNKKSEIYKEPVEADIGQVFLPQAHGILHTNFNSGDNFNIVPGFKGWFQYKGIKLQKDQNGNTVNVGEPRMKRLRLSGYTQMLHQRLDEDLSSQVLRMGDPAKRELNQQEIANSNGSNEPHTLRNINDLTSPRDSSILNGLYHSELIGERVPDHWVGHLLHDSHMTRPEVNAILNTKRGRISFDKHYAQINTDDIRNPSSSFALITDGHSMKNMPLSDYRNMIDTSITSGGKQQGLTLYLVAGELKDLHKQKDGTYAVSPLSKNQIRYYARKMHVNPSRFVARAPIGYLPPFKYLSRIPWDRKSVAEKYAINEIFRTMSRGQNVPGIRTAYATFGGDNMEDSTIISKATADRNQVPERNDHNKLLYVDKNGNTTTKNTGTLKMRPLHTGDKIDDFGHNKATVGLVIDPNMSMDEARARHIGKEVAIFKQNPDLGIVMSPHSPITRGNGAIADKAMEDNSRNVKPVIYTDPQGHAHKIGVSSIMDFMALKLTSDKQTVTYDSYNIQHGKARKFSSQMFWGINAQRYKDPEGKWHHIGKGILKAVYGQNPKSVKALADLREYLLATGFDLDRGGAPRVMDAKNISKYHPQEHRQQFVDRNTARSIAKHEIERDSPNFDVNGYAKQYGAKELRDKLLGKFQKEHPNVLTPKTSEDFLKDLGSRGGTLTLPFKVRFESYDPAKKSQYDQDRDNAMSNLTAQRSKLPWAQYKQLSQNTFKKIHDEKNDAYTTSNQLPIMSSHLRNNMTLLRDGATQINDYNSYYAHNNSNSRQHGIFEDALKYSNNKAKYEKYKYGPNPNKFKAKGYKSKMRQAHREAQQNVNKIEQEVINRQLGGWQNGKSLYNKHSFMRTKILAHPLGHSTTAVSQNDMRLPIDTIAVSPHIYETLFGKKAKENAKEATGKDSDGIPKGMAYDPKLKNTRVLLTRDPVIYNGSERGFKVVMDKSKYMGQGFKMPAVDDNSFKGDNDGDTYSIINISAAAHSPKTKKAVQTDLKHMSVPYQLVDYSGSKAIPVPNKKSPDKVSYKYSSHPVSFLDVASDFIAGAQQAGQAVPQYIKDGKSDDNTSELEHEGILGKNGDTSKLKKAIEANPYDSISKADAKNGVYGKPIKQQIETKLLNIAGEKVVNTKAGKVTLHKYEPRYDNGVGKLVKSSAYEHANPKDIDNDATMKQREHDTNHFKNVCIRNDFGASTLDFTNEKSLFQSMGKTAKVQGAKGNPKAIRTFNDYRLGVSSAIDEMGDYLLTKENKKPKALATKKQMNDQVTALHDQMSNISKESDVKPKTEAHSPRYKAAKQLISNAMPEILQKKDEHGNIKDPNNNHKLDRKMYPLLMLRAIKNCQKHGNKNYIEEFDAQTLSFQDIKMQNALAAKAFNTASAGTKPQQLESAIGDKYPDLALVITYQETQANLQGKHHPDLIPATTKMLNQRVPNLLQGHRADAPSFVQFAKGVQEKNKKEHPNASKIPAKEIHGIYEDKYSGMTPKEFTQEYCDTFRKAGTDVNPKFVKKFADLMAPNGIVQPLAKLKQAAGGPTYRDAYAGHKLPGGFKNKINMAEHNFENPSDIESFTDGKYSARCYPDQTREFNEDREHQKSWNNVKDQMIDNSNLTQKQQDIQKAEQKANSVAHEEKFNKVSLHDRTAEQDKAEQNKRDIMAKINDQKKAERQTVGATPESSQQTENDPTESAGLNDADINYDKTPNSGIKQNQSEHVDTSAVSSSSEPSSEATSESSSTKTSANSKAPSSVSEKKPAPKQPKSKSTWRDFETSSIKADKHNRERSEEMFGSNVNKTPSSENETGSDSENGSSSATELTSAQIHARQRSVNAQKASESGDEF